MAPERIQIHATDSRLGPLPLRVPAFSLYVLLEASTRDVRSLRATLRYSMIAKPFDWIGET